MRGVSLAYVVDLLTPGEHLTSRWSLRHDKAIQKAVDLSTSVVGSVAVCYGMPGREINAAYRDGKPVPRREHLDYLIHGRGHFRELGSMTPGG